GKRHAQGLDGGCHSICRIHSPACSCPWARQAHNTSALVLVDLASDALTVTLECGDDVQLSILVVPGPDRAAIDHKRGTVKPTHCDQTTRHVFVAAGYRNIGVIPLSAHNGFNRIGDQIARLKLEDHAVRTHRDAIAHTDCVETHSHESCCRNALFDAFRQLEKMHV